MKDKKKLIYLISAIALVLVAAIVIVCLVTCGKNGNDDNTDNGTSNNGGTTDNGSGDNGGNAQQTTAKTYTLALAVDTTVGTEDNKVSNYVAALVLDEANKIVAVRIDCVETTPAIADGAIADVASVASKVSLGDGYAMNAGSFAKQTKAFEDAIVGKTAEEVANLDMTLVSGCTMPYSPFSFKAVVAKAISNAR